MLLPHWGRAVVVHYYITSFCFHLLNLERLFPSFFHWSFSVFLREKYKLYCFHFYGTTTCDYCKTMSQGQLSHIEITKANFFCFIWLHSPTLLHWAVMNTGCSVRRKKSWCSLAEAVFPTSIGCAAGPSAAQVGLCKCMGKKEQRKKSWKSWKYWKKG